MGWVTDACWVEGRYVWRVDGERRKWEVEAFVGCWWVMALMESEGGGLHVARGLGEMVVVGSSAGSCSHSIVVSQYRVDSQRYGPLIAQDAV